MPNLLETDEDLNLDKLSEPSNEEQKIFSENINSNEDSVSSSINPDPSEERQKE